MRCCAHDAALKRITWRQSIWVGKHDATRSSRCAGAPILVWYVDACSAAWGARDCAEALAWLHHVFMELRLRAIATCRGVMVARRPRANNKTLANIEAALKRARCERRCSFRRRVKKHIARVRWASVRTPSWLLSHDVPFQNVARCLSNKQNIYYLASKLIMLSWPHIFVQARDSMHMCLSTRCVVSCISWAAHAQQRALRCWVRCMEHIHGIVMTYMHTLHGVLLV